MRLIFTSDIHSYLFPTTFAEKADRNIGHYRIIGSYEKDKDTVVVDGGDNIQGSALSKYVIENKLFNPFPQAETFRKGGLDLAVPGNHDFNYGRDIFSLFFKELGAQILCANLEDKRGLLDIKKHIVLTDSTGLRVGFTGLVTDYVNVWESKENIESFIVSDVKEAAERELKWLKSNSDYSVLIYHGGFECDLKTGKKLLDSRENIGYEICQDLDYSLLLSGHQHLGVDFTKVNNTYVMQCPSFASAYCLVELTKDGIRGELKAPNAEATGEEKKHIKLRENVESWLDKACGEIEEEIKAPSQIESLLHGNHIADFFNYIQMQATGADISVCALNNNLFSFSKEVTIREILASYQYPNSLCVVEIDEEGLKSALERTAEFFSLTQWGPTIDQKFLCPKMEMYNYDYYYGIEYEFDISKKVGERVTKLRYKGEEIGSRKLSLVLNNYRITGAGGYDIYPKCKVIRILDKDVQDLSVEYLLKHKGKPLSWPKAEFSTKGYSIDTESHK